MDKSFNEQELSDIMKEIEALEEDLTTATEMKATETPSTLEATSQILEELAQLDEVTAVPQGRAEVVSVNEKRSPGANVPTSMSFKVQGNLALELQFDIGGKIVCLEVTETGLSIEMDGGVKFTVPVTENKGHKKVA